MGAITKLIRAIDKIADQYPTSWFIQIPKRLTMTTQYQLNRRSSQIAPDFFGNWLLCDIQTTPLFSTRLHIRLIASALAG
jgi:hypothetical protein